MRRKGRSTPIRQTHYRILVYVLCQVSPHVFRRLLTVVGEYFVVNQILAKGLHLTDDDLMRYTTTIVEKLEEVGNPLSINMQGRVYSEGLTVQSCARQKDSIRTNQPSPTTP